MLVLGFVVSYKDTNNDQQARVYFPQILLNIKISYFFKEKLVIT